MSGAQAQENHELKEEIKKLNEEVQDLADANETLVNKLADLPKEEIDLFENSSRFVTAYIAMYYRANTRLELADERIKKLESDLVFAYQAISDARACALENLSDMDTEKQIESMNEVIDLLPEEIKDAKG
jgi:septal ring factor EnvC (AmiA/AmiB activator)